MHLIQSLKNECCFALHLFSKYPATSINSYFYKMSLHAVLQFMAYIWVDKIQYNCNLILKLIDKLVNIFPFSQGRKEVKGNPSPEDKCISNQNQFGFEREIYISQIWGHICFHTEFSFHWILKNFIINTCLEKKSKIK